MRSFGSFWRSWSRRCITVAPSDPRTGCLPPVGIRSEPMVLSAVQSSLQMELYSFHSEDGAPGSDANAVLPKRRQYSVTPRAQMSIAFVMGGRFVVWLLEGLPAFSTFAKEEDPGEESFRCSYMISGARNEGVPARLVKSEASRRMGSSGSSATPACPAEARRCA